VLVRKSGRRKLTRVTQRERASFENELKSVVTMSYCKMRANDGGWMRTAAEEPDAGRMKTRGRARSRQTREDLWKWRAAPEDMSCIGEGMKARVEGC
jgi:hypothetical protein